MVTAQIAVSDQSALSGPSHKPLARVDNDAPQLDDTDINPREAMIRVLFLAWAAGPVLSHQRAGNARLTASDSHT